MAALEAAAPPHAPARPRVVPGRLALIWLACFCGFFLIGAVSTLAAPLTSVPDESNHVVRAVSLDRGQLLGPQARGTERAEIRVVVPKTFAALERMPKCFQLFPEQSAACQPPLVSSGRLVETKTYVGRYPPTYYAVVGLPSLFSSSPDVIYAMRFVSLAMSSALLALALALALFFDAGSLLVLGTLTAITPEVLFDSSVVQPSGMEMAAGVAVWVSLTLLLWRRRRPARVLVHSAGAASVALVLTRDISPFWFVAIGLVVLAGARRGATRRLVKRRDARIWAGVVAAAAAFEVTWDLVAHPFWIYTRVHPIPSSDTEAVLRAFRHIPTWAVESVSTFGYRTSLAPLATYLVVAVAVIALLVTGLRGARRRERVAIALVVAGAILIPVVIVSAAARSYGELWSGRYSMPFAVGIPILCGRATRERPDWLQPALAGAWVVVTVMAFWAELRRYTVGDRGPLDLIFTFHPAWQPPLTLPVLAIAAVVVPVGLALGTLWLSRPPPPTEPIAP